MAKNVLALALAIFVFVTLSVERSSGHESFAKYLGNLETRLHFDFDFSTSISNELCNRHLAAYQNSLQRNELWARTMRDSWGKVPSGLFSGNYFDLGSFDQCINVIHSSNVGEIAGQHCTLMIPYDLDVNNPETRLATPSRS